MSKQGLPEHYQEYVSQCQAGMAGVDMVELAKAIDLLTKCVTENRKVFVGGNGGSAAISNHLCCDFIKGTDRKGYPPLKTFSLSCNTPLITAIANDLGYQHTLSYQLERMLEADDVVILISSSGNSSNIIEAIGAAHTKGAKVIGLSGFSGGDLKYYADINLHVPINNYGVVEDCHQSLMHIISQYIYKERTADVGF